MFSPMTMVGRSLAQAATQTLRPAVTRAATQAGGGSQWHEVRAHAVELYD